VLQLEGDTRIGLEVAPAGKSPSITRFGIRVAPYDHGLVTDRLRQFAAEVLYESAADGLIRFRDNDGITLEVIAG
jgi:hypothetical protein